MASISEAGPGPNAIYDTFDQLKKNTPESEIDTVPKLKKWAVTALKSHREVNKKEVCMDIIRFTLQHCNGMFDSSLAGPEPITAAHEPKEVDAMLEELEGPRKPMSFWLPYFFPEMCDEDGVHKFFSAKDLRRIIKGLCEHYTRDFESLSAGEAGRSPRPAGAPVAAKAQDVARDGAQRELRNQASESIRKRQDEEEELLALKARCEGDNFADEAKKALNRPDITDEQLGEEFCKFVDSLKAMPPTPMRDWFYKYFEHYMNRRKEVFLKGRILKNVIETQARSTYTQIEAIKCRSALELHNALTPILFTGHPDRYYCELSQYKFISLRAFDVLKKFTVKPPPPLSVESAGGVQPAPAPHVAKGARVVPASASLDESSVIVEKGRKPLTAQQFFEANDKEWDAINNPSVEFDMDKFIEYFKRSVDESPESDCVNVLFTRLVNVLCDQPDGSLPPKHDLKKILSRMILRTSYLIVVEMAPETHVSANMPADKIVELSRRWQALDCCYVGRKFFYQRLFEGPEWDKTAVPDHLVRPLAGALELLIIAYIKKIKKPVTGGKPKADGASARVPKKGDAEEVSKHVHASNGEGRGASAKVAEESSQAPAVAEALKATKKKKSKKRLEDDPDDADMSDAAPAVAEVPALTVSKKHKSGPEQKPADQEQASAAGGGNAPPLSVQDRMKQIQQRRREKQ